MKIQEKPARLSLILIGLILYVLPASAGAVRSFAGFQSTTLAKDDEVSSAAVPLGFTIDFLGRSISTVYVNTNGNLTFDGPYSGYPGMPSDSQSGTVIPPINGSTRQIIAGFFADIDTSSPSLGAVSYGTTTLNGRAAFVANFSSVSYYRWYITGSDVKHNTFQIILIDRGDTGPGNFDIELNYDQVEWETADSSGGVNGLGGYSAQIGYANGTKLPGTFYELPGSEIPGSFLSGPQSLLAGSLNSGGVAGRYLLAIRNGVTPTGPAITTLSPSTAQAGGPQFNLTVNGAGFTAGSTALWNGSPLPTTFVSASQVTATVAASLITSQGTATVTVNAGGTASNGSVFTITSATAPPGPAISNLSPSSAQSGGSAFTLTVNGSNFTAGSTVLWNGSPLSTVFGSSTQLTASVAAGLITSQGTATVTVNTNGVASNGSVFTITAGTAPPPPGGAVISGLSPSTATAGGSAFTLSVNGSNFTAGSTVLWNGVPLPTTFVNASQLSAAVSSGLIAVSGAATITVSANGAASNSFTFTISVAGTSPLPVITSLNPSTAQAGGPTFTLTVNGSAFTANSVVLWTGNPLPTTFVSANQLTATVAANLIASQGTALVTVNANGTASNSSVLTITAVTPTITGLSPSTLTVGGPAFTLTVNGSGFVASSTIVWNGTPIATAFVSATQLTAAIPAAFLTSPGTFLITVTTAGASSNSSTITIAAPAGPKITSLSPITTQAGGPAFTLTVNGSGFLAGSVILWNGSPLPTVFVSATQLTASVAATLIASPGSGVVTVTANGLASSSSTVAITAPPSPTITSLNPTTAPAGGPTFTLTVNGSNFAAGSTILWNGSPLPTSFVSAAQLTASVAATWIVSPGTGAVTVSANGFISNGSAFTITAPATPTITSLAPSTAQAGGAAFTLTVNGSAFAANSTVLWNDAPLPTSFVNAGRLTASVGANLITSPATANVTVSANGVTSNGSAFTITAVPTPTITSLAPSTAQAGGAAFTLTVNGSTFAANSTVLWNDAPLPTSFVNAGRLTASVGANLITSPATANVTVSANGATSNGSAFTITAPATPTITSLSPTTAQAGGVAFTLTVNGSAFAANSTVLWNDAPLPTSFVNAGRLTASVGANLITSPATANVTVSANGITSNGSPFTITAPATPTITSLAPSTAQAGGAAFTLTVNGSAFAANSTVLWNDAPLPTSFVNAGKLTASVGANLITSPATATVTVSANGVTSNGSAFTITAAPAPTITSLAPTTAQAGGAAFTLTVNGSAFAANSTVLWNDTPLPTAFVSASRLTASIGANLITSAGTATVTVSANGATSNGSPFTITAPPTPTITSLSPSTAQAGGAAFTLTVNGSAFTASSTILWNDTPLPTTFVNVGRLTASVDAALIISPGTATVTVSANGVTSNGSAFTITAVPTPTITSLAPSTAQAGGPAFTLTVNGSAFTANSTVLWNDSALPTTFVSATQLTASVATNLITSVGTATVTVSANGVTSNGSAFTITAAPTPTITSLAPSTAQAGGAAFTLTVNGSAFSANSTVLWNEAPLPTTFVNAGKLTASVGANLITSVGTATVTVSANGVTSNGSAFTITAPPASTITSLSPSTTQAGGAAFTLTVNGSAFTANSTVLWNDAPLPTTFVTAGKLTASVGANLITSVGTATVTVSANGVTSNGSAFTITAPPASTITSLSPSTTQAGGAVFTLTVNGSAFAANSTVLWNDTALPTTFVNAGRLTASVDATLITSPGTATVTVNTNGVASNGSAFAITAAPTPTITSLAPSTAQAGGPGFTLTVNGSTFTANSTVLWNNSALPTTFVNATQLTASVATNLITSAGTATVTVSANSVVSNGSAFTITATPAPSITSLAPATAQTGAAFTLTVNGLAFTANSTVLWNDTPLPTTFVNTTQLTASVAANLTALPGTATVTVNANGVASNGSAFNITTAPPFSVTSMTPSTAQAGAPSFTLTVNGAGFAANSAVLWNSTPLPTTFVNATQLTAAVSANFIVSQGSVSIAVTLGNGVSNALTFTITSGTGPLSVFPTELNFSARSGAPAPDAANISVWNNGAPAKFRVTSTAGVWLNLSSATGQTNQSFSVAPNITAVSPGVYNGQLQVTMDSAPSVTRTIPVTLTLAATPEPKLAIAPLNQVVELTSGTQAKYQLMVTNSTAGKLSFYTQAPGVSWLSMQTTFGTASPARPSSLNYTLDTTGLAAGIYNADIIVSDIEDIQRLVAKITLIVSDRRPSIAVSQTGLAFTLASQQPAQTKSFNIRNLGLALAPVRVEWETFSEGPAWLSATPSLSTLMLDAGSAVTVNVLADPRGLTPGQYFGLVRIRAGFSDENVQSIPVLLNVQDTALTSGGGRISPPGIVLAGNAGIATAKIQLSNPTASPITFSSVPGADWMSLSPAGGSIAAFQTLEVDARVDLAKVAAGIRSDLIRIPFGDGTIGTLNVLSVISPAGQSAAAPCLPSSLYVQVTSLEPDFAVTAGGIATVQARVLDNCGSPRQTGAVIARISDEPNPLILSYEDQGLWAATWSPRKARPAVQVAVVAGSGEGPSRLTGQAAVSGIVNMAFSSAPPLPDTIANTASFRNAGQIAPGSLVAITGEGLADAPAKTTDQPYPTELGGVSVTLGGVRLPLFSVTPNQLNAFIPFNATPDTLQQLVVKRGSTLSMPINIQLAETTPGIYSADQSGSGQGAVVIAGSGGVMAAPRPSGRPAKIGETLQIFCTGLGLVSNPPQNGQTVSADTQAPTVNPVKVSIASAPVPVSYAGLVPGFVGLYEVDVKLTNNVPGGEAPIVISVGGKESNTVTIQIE